MLLEGFPGPQHCPLLPLTAAQAVNADLGGHPQPPNPATPALLQPPSQRPPGPGAALPQPGAFPQLLPVGPGPCPGFSARRPSRSSSQRLPGLGLRQGSRSLPESILRPFPPPSPPANRPGPTPVEAEEGRTRREGGEGGYGRPAPHSAPPSRSVPERGLSSTSPAPSLRFRPARPQSLCARVPGPLAGTTSRGRAPTHVSTPTSTCPPYGTPRKDLFLVHPRRAGVRPRSDSTSHPSVPVS